MPRSLPINFRIHVPEPIEVKMISMTLHQRDSIPEVERFKGLFTYVVEDDTFYYLSGGVENDNWKAIGKPQAIEILDVFTGQPQKIISGYGLQQYLQENYYTRQEIDTLLEALELPAHLAEITPEDVQKLKTIQGDVSQRVDFTEAKILWAVPHPSGKSCMTFDLLGRRIYGRETKVSDIITSFSWSQPIAGYAEIN